MRIRVLGLAGLAALMVSVQPSFAQSQTSPPLNGVWSLNHPLSEFPKEFGFTIDVSSAVSDDAPPPTGGGGGGRGRRSGGRTAGTPATARRESYEDNQRVQLMTNEARNPPARLMIVDSGAAVTITNELGQSRTIHPNARQEPVEIQGVVFMTTARRDGDRVIADFQVERDRVVRYTYSPAAGPHQLGVDVELLDHGDGQKAKRVYDAGTTANEAVAANRPSGSPPVPAASNEPPRESFDQRPGAEFKGLKNVGLVVEDFGPEAQGCGLKRDVIEDALARRLTAGGLTVRRNADEDTYVYVNLITTAMPNGTCVSRYDAYLYTQATAKVSYRDQPVLVLVSLAHRGSIGSSSAASHAAAISHGLEGYVDLFVTQIRDANK